LKVATPKKTIAAMIAQLLVRSSGRIALGEVLRSTAIAIAKQIAVITIASATEARKKCSRPSRAFKPKTKPSIGAPFWRHRHRNSFPSREPARPYASSWFPDD
jgi:hypothetical protein